MRNMAVLHSPAFSYPLPVLVRVLSNLLIFKGKILYYNKYIRFYLLPDVTFKNIGWLCDVRQAEFINNAVALDVLHKELIEYYSLQNDAATWSRQRETFINYMNNL